jgi:hypothetical protein
MAERVGVEPTGAEARRLSGALPYQLGDLSREWWTGRELNPEPSACGADALPIELRGPRLLELPQNVHDHRLPCAHALLNRTQGRPTTNATGRFVASPKKRQQLRIAFQLIAADARRCAVLPAIGASARCRDDVIESIRFSTAIYTDVAHENRTPFFRLVGREGIEPPISWSQAKRLSTRLSPDNHDGAPCGESNSRHPLYRSGALPSELTGQSFWRRVKESNLHAREGVCFRDRGDTNSATTLRAPALIVLAVASMLSKNWSSLKCLGAAEGFEPSTSWL